jgi:lysosomal-associated membrane protein 1/2
VGANSTVNGTQTGDKTVFNIFAIDNVKKNDVEWSLTFEKSSKGEVKLVRSTVRYDTTGWPHSNNDVVTVEWTNAVPMANSSSNAYKCSSVGMTNGKDYFVITDARIQPFDVKDSKFGSDVVCAQDQPSPPVIGDWTVTQYGDYTCIKFTSFVYLMINYTTTDNTNATAVVLVPANASVSTEKNNSCNYNFDTKKIDGTEQVLRLTFIPVGQKSQNNWILTLTFTNNSVFTGDSKNIDAYKADLQFYYDPAIFPQASRSSQTGHFYNNVNMSTGEGALKMFDAASDHSYRCNANDTTTVDPDYFSIRTESLRVEAFLQNSTTLLTEHVCKLDQQQETSDLIPIIIGAALAALVVIVLVAYLIGRARARGSNYETI